MSAVTARDPRPRRPAPAPRWDALAARLVPCLLVLALWLAVIPASGGYFPRTWYPAALASLLLFCAMCVARRRSVPADDTARAVLGLFAALVAWSFLSIAWAGSPGDAWEAANKLLLPLGAAATIALIPWTRGTLTILLGVWSLGVALICASRLVTWLRADDLLAFVEPASGRIDDPLGYPNASAALPVMGMLGALALSSVRETPPAVRAAALPVAVFLAEFSLFSQSRGAIVGGVVALVALVVLAGDRGRLAVRLAVGAAIVAPAVGPVLAVGDAVLDLRLATGPLHHAARWIAATVVVTALAGAALAVLDARVRPSARTSRVAGVVATGLVAVALLGAAVAYGGRVSDWAREAWRAGTAPSGESRLLSLAPEERPDYARVSLDLFTERPLEGAGVGNFGREYDARRHFEKHSRYAHDIWLRALGETGAVGFLLLVGLVAALAVGVLSRWRRHGPYERTLIAAAVAVGTYLLVHGSLDWLDEYPALVLPAVGLPVAALTLHRPGRRRRSGRPKPFAQRSPWPSRLAGAAVGLAVLAALASLLPAWVAVRYEERARQAWTAAPAAAFDDLRRAAELNRLSIDPLITEGSLALQLGRANRARSAFREALGREQHWYPYLALAVLEARDRRYPAARALLARAAALDAQDPVIAYARARIDHDRPVDLAGLTRQALDNPLFRPVQMP